MYRENQTNFYQAPKITPYPGPRSVIILDNCAIHHDEDIRRILVDECGMSLLTPPSRLSNHSRG